MMNFLKLYILVFVSATFCQNDDEPLMKVWPHHYDIKITYQESSGKFHGVSTVIKLNVLSPVETLRLHYLRLDINTTETILIRDEDNSFLTPTHVFDENAEILTLDFHKCIEKGSYSLHFKYSGRTSRSNIRNNYLELSESDNEEQVMIAGVLDFPCWIYAKLKSTFSVTVYHPPQFTALSNMPLEKRNEGENDRVKSIFRQTPSMSAMHVCYMLLRNDKFKSISEGKLRIWTDNEDIDRIKLAQEIAIQTLSTFGEYTDIQFPLPKLDLVIADIPMLPSAVSFWGIILLQKVHVLNNDEYNLSKLHFNLAQYHICILVIHEIIHQWIEGLVTFKSAEDSWISEGLPTYFEQVLFAKILGDSKIEDLGFSLTISSAFQKDEELINNRETPINLNGMTLLEGTNKYFKGASIMFMLRDLVTKEVFDFAIKNFLKDHQYKKIASEDFWNAIKEEFAKYHLKEIKDVNMILRTYISQLGYPVINVNRDYTNGNIILTQTSLFTGEKFWIPISVQLIVYSKSNEIGHETVQKRLVTSILSSEMQNLSIAVDPEEWYIININKGYYRVNYDQENLERIAENLLSSDFEKISVLNRFTILNDAFFFYSKALIKFDLFSKLIKYLNHETNLCIWMLAKDIFQHMVSSKVGVPYDIFMGFVKRVFKHLGTIAQPTDSFYDIEIRNTASFMFKIYFPN